MIALGYGAFLRDFLRHGDSSLGDDITKIYVDEKFKKSSHWEGYELITDLSSFSEEEFICGLSDPFHNFRLYSLALSHGLKLTNKYYVAKLGNEKQSKDSEIGAGTIIGPHCAVYAESKIGKCCQILNHTIVSHNVTIGDFNTLLGAYTLIGGYTNIGNNNIIGAGSKIKNNLIIGSNCSISIGTIVMKNIPDNKIVYTNSTKTLNKINKSYESI